MARLSDVRSFDRTAYRATVKGMRDRGEGVHDEGREYLQTHKEIHPYVDVRKNRGSHNAMIPGDKPGTYVLMNGIALPILSMFDGTGSTSKWLEDFFHACERQYLLMDGARPRYNTQLASSVVQDVCDVHTSPVVQLSQFESDERSAEQVRLLLPAGSGGDSAEDYDLGLASALFVYSDLWTYYGLKGYLTLTADDIGRGFVTDEGAQHYLGQSLGQLGLFQSVKKVDTSEICRKLLEHWHLYLLQVPAAEMLSYSTKWWKEVLGPSRVIKVKNPRLLAEVRAALVYVTEVKNPTKRGLIEFMQRSGTQEAAIDARDLEEVWRVVQVAEEHFGAQAKLPGYDDIPLPGDKFSHYRHAWPIGHPRESENVTPEEAPTTSD